MVCKQFQLRQIFQALIQMIFITEKQIHLIVEITDSGLSSITLDNPNPSVAEGSSYSGTIVLDDPPNITLTQHLQIQQKHRLFYFLTFTPGNYNVPQGYTINGIEDFIVDGIKMLI